MDGLLALPVAVCCAEQQDLDLCCLSVAHAWVEQPLSLWQDEQLPGEANANRQGSSPSEDGGHMLQVKAGSPLRSSCTEEARCKTAASSIKFFSNDEPNSLLHSPGIKRKLLGGCPSWLRWVGPLSLSVEARVTYFIHVCPP